MLAICQSLSVPKRNRAMQFTQHGIVSECDVGFERYRMALAIDITDGRGLSNEAHRELLLKKSKVMLY